MSVHSSRQVPLQMRVTMIIIGVFDIINCYGARIPPQTLPPLHQRHRLSTHHLLTNRNHPRQSNASSIQAKRLVKAANKLIHFARKADQGFTSPLNLLKGRVTTEQVYKKLLMETIPKLENVPQNFVTMSKITRRRRGDNAPMVYVTVKGSEKEEIAKIQEKEAR